MVLNKQTHRTSSWDRANYVFRICSMALWAFMPLSLLIHSIGLDISQEQPTALIPSAETGHSEFAGCGMSLIIGVQMGAEYVMAKHALTPPPHKIQNKQGTGFPTRQPLPCYSPGCGVDYF